MVGHSSFRLLSRALLSSPNVQVYHQSHKPISFLKPVSSFTLHLKHSPSLRHFLQKPAVGLAFKQHYTQKAQVVSENKEDTPASITYNSWLDRLPPKLSPYVYLTRMDKPIGTWLLYWPCGKLSFTGICFI